MYNGREKERSRKGDAIAEESNDKERWMFRPRLNFDQVFLGLLILFVGLAYLLRNLGVIDLTPELNWVTIWSIIIIFIGLSMLSARSWLVVVLGLAAIVLALAAIFGTKLIQFTPNTISRNWDWRVGTPVQTGTQLVEIEKSPQISRAKVDIKTGAGQIRIVGGSDKLISGNLDSNFLSLDTASTVEDNLQEIDLKIMGRSRIMGRHLNNLDLKLNSNTPMELDLATGAVDAKIDLTKVIAERVDVDLGASGLQLALGDLAKTSDVSIDAGASSIKLSLPRSAGVKIEISSGLSSRSLLELDKVSSNTYQSRNYDMAEKKINLNLRLGASSLEVNWR